MWRTIHKGGWGSFSGQQIMLGEMALVWDRRDITVRDGCSRDTEGRANQRAFEWA